MKIFIIHDDTGQIRGTVVPLSKVMSTGVKPASGLRVLAIQPADMEPALQKKYIQELHHRHRVDMTAAEPIVVCKNLNKNS